MEYQSTERLAFLWVGREDISLHLGSEVVFPIIDSIVVFTHETIFSSRASQRQNLAPMLYCTESGGAGHKAEILTELWLNTGSFSTTYFPASSL